VNDNDDDCTDGRRDSDDDNDVCSSDGTDTRFVISIFCRFFRTDVFVIRRLRVKGSVRRRFRVVVLVVVVVCGFNNKSLLIFVGGVFFFF